MVDSEVEWLRKKVAEQDRRLVELEQFQGLAEIPLKLADLYQFPPPRTELSPTQLAEVTQSLYSRLFDTLSTQESLEDSLRSEVLECERQRVYIQILEQAVLERAEGLGFTDSLYEFIDLPRTKIENEGMKLELEKTKVILEQNEVLEQSLTLAMEDLAPVQEATFQALDEKTAIESSQKAAQEQLASLEEERNTLAQYIAGKKDIEDRYTALEFAYQQLQAAYKEAQDLRFNLDSRFRILTKDAEEQKLTKEKVSSLVTQNQGLKKQLQVTQSEVSTLEVKLQTLEGEKTTGIKEFSRLTGLSKNLSDTRTSLESNLETLSATLHLGQQDLIKAKSDLDWVEQQLWERNKTTEPLQSEIEALEANLERTVSDTSNLRRDYDQVVRSHQNTQEEADLELVRCKEDLESLLRNRNHVVSDLQATRRRISHLQTDISASRTAAMGVEDALKSETLLRHQVLETRKAVDESREEILQLAQARTALKYKLLEVIR